MTTPVKLTNPLARWPVRTSLVLTALFAVTGYLHAHAIGGSVRPVALGAVLALVFTVLVLRGRELRRRALEGHDAPPRPEDG